MTSPTDNGTPSSLSVVSDLPHCHSFNGERVKLDKQARLRLVIVSALCLIFMFVQGVGGVLAHSLSIASEGAHLLGDFTMFLICIFSLWVATYPGGKRLNYGWLRAEVLGSLISVIILWGVTGILAYNSVMRIIEGNSDVDPKLMLITAAIGLTINIIMTLALTLGGVPHGHSHGGHGGHGDHSHIGQHIQMSSFESDEQAHSHEDVEDNLARIHKNSIHRGTGHITVRVALVHVLADLFESAGVLIAALVIFYYPEYHVIDSITNLVCSAITILTTFPVLRDVINVLMEGTPKDLDIGRVKKAILEIEGVRQVHNLRGWSLTLDKVVLTAHIAIEKGHEPNLILNETLRKVKSKYDFYEVTIQVEQFKDQMLTCKLCR